MILLRLSRERDEALLCSEALDPGPVGQFPNTSLSTDITCISFSTWLVHRTSAPQARGSNPGLGKKPKICWLTTGVQNRKTCPCVRHLKYQPVYTGLHQSSSPQLNRDNNADREFGIMTTQSLKELWFQQDGATCHTARATIDLLKDTFGDHLISRFGPVNWPPRSCDLTPLDYFLWGYVKSLVYADKPQTLDHLEDNIRRVIADIRPQMLEKVIENWTSRLVYIRASRGSPMPEIIFKM
ncbi:heat shock 70kDa protein 8 [Trichonephila clavipes]|nr:heat shock 70kDa protein 8 [Trichonephila clavipes]